VTSARIGILGGTFDPIHRGHLDAAAAAEDILGLTQVFVVPSHVPPHRSQPLASSFHRFAMVALAVAGRPGWRASDVELRSSPPSYTAATLTSFHQRGYHPYELFFVVGADAFVDIQAWKGFPQLLDHAHFVVISRPGTPVTGLPERLPALAPRMSEWPATDPELRGAPLIILIDAPTADVSSTAVRERRAAGGSVAGLVDPRVQQHIEQHGLYVSAAPGRRRSDNGRDPAAGRLHGQS
jgi:nicotinate-nucleotide adenylyltransferase